MPESWKTLGLLAEDDGFAAAVTRAARDAGATLARARTWEDLERAIEAGDADVAVVALGSDVDVARLSLAHSTVPVVVAVTDAHVPLAVAALRAGALDYVLVPAVEEQLTYVIGKLLAVQPGCARTNPERSARPMIGDSKVMRDLGSIITRAAQGPATVLIRGESGTGKELVARALHDESPRRAGPFVKIDCTSLPEPLLESELFGYEKGAFTGATAKKPGRVELAEGGTLFLDEIGELGPPLQAKLLRLLQDRELERLGGTKTVKVDARVVAATHRDLETMVEQGGFRQDLFYRLNVVCLWLPPLRARRADIDVLTRHFVARFGSEGGKAGLTIDEGAVRALRAQRWPGNVRQLENTIERLVVLSESDRITEADVQADGSTQVRFQTQPESTGSAGTPPAPRGAQPDSVVGPLDRELFAAERRALVRALERTNGNRVLAARLLGIGRSTLYDKLAEHGIR